MKCLLSLMVLLSLNFFACSEEKTVENQSNDQSNDGSNGSNEDGDSTLDPRPSEFLKKVSITDWDNQIHDLDKERDGKPVLLVFILPTCQYCKAFLDLLKANYPELKDRIVPIIVSMASSYDSKLYMSKYDYPFSIMIDQDAVLALHYGFEGQVPYTLFINKNDKILRYQTGYSEENAATFLQIIEDTIADTTK